MLVAPGRFSAEDETVRECLLRFFEKVRFVANGCWLWTAATARGYGVFSFNRLPRKAHRIAYELLVGPIPNGHDLHHEFCAQPLCVHPGHMRPVSRDEHAEITAKARRLIECKRGHPMAGDNVYIFFDARGVRHRTCRTCRKEKMRAWREARKALAT